MRREAVSVFIAIVIASSFIGVFTDAPKVEENLCGLTIGFWKTNAAKDLGLKHGKPQVKMDEYEDLLECVNTTYGSGIDDWSEWNITSLADDEDLEWALHWLSYGAYDPDTDEFTNPEASNPQVKARGQLLALLLTACYKEDYIGAIISVPGYDYGMKTISEWISQIISEYNEGHFNVVHEIANYLNEHCASPYTY